MTQFEIVFNLEYFQNYPQGANGPWCAPCRHVLRASVDDVCARCDFAQNVEANKLGLYMGTARKS